MRQAIACLYILLGKASPSIEDVQYEFIVFILDTILQSKGEATMKITQTAQKIKLNLVMDISVDVHEDTLNFFFETKGKEYSDDCSNRTNVIEQE